MMQRLAIAADAGFWPAAALAVRDFALRNGCPDRQFQSLLWLISGQLAPSARSALRQVVHGALIPPQIMPLAQWLGMPLAAGVAARAEMFGALRGNTWVRQSFGDQPSALWALARSASELCDELSWAAAGHDEAFAGRLRAAFARHFHRRAARAMDPQAQLILHLWRARQTADPVAAVLRELAARAADAQAPLVYLAADPLQAWEQAFLHAYAQHAEVLLIEPDSATVTRSRPVLAAAWPELLGGPIEAIAQRAAQVPPGARPLQILATRSLEEEAAAVAQQVLDWRRGGVDSIGLIALDRLTARRVRATLERAQIVVRDEMGWKLSTTSGAAAVMRWFDLVADDVYWRDLLDWLKSPFVFAGRADKDGEVAAIERAIRANGIVQGIEPVRAALLDRADETPTSALDLLDRLAAQLPRMRRPGPTLVAHAAALNDALDALGMRAGLLSDPVGRAVLREIEAVAAEIAAIGSRATLADYRALLAARFEETAYVDAGADSPVVMVSLAGAALRPFDAAVLIGADAQHLPAAPEDRLFMSDAMRAELGLADIDAERRRQTRQLAGLLATVPHVVATWRAQSGDEDNALSPLLERLQFVTLRAQGDDLLAVPDAARIAVTAQPMQRPAPAASMLAPAAITASQTQSLVNCGYQFYARHLLRLAELEDVIEMPDKREFGTYVHEILCRFHRAQGAVDFSLGDPAQLAAALRAEAQAVFAPQIERTPGLLAQARRFDGLVGGYIDWLRERAAAGWRWQASELRCSRGMPLAGGGSVELIGRIDRIDTHADGEVAVIDYKARGADTLRSGLREAGEDVQLPFYGLLRADCTAAFYLSLDRARETDRGVEEVVPKQEFVELTRQVGERLARDLQRIADGAPLPAIGAESVCAYCEMRGLCRRDYWIDEESGAVPGPAATHTDEDER